MESFNAHVGSTSQVAEKGLRKAIACFKEHLKLGIIESYGWIQGKDIIANILTKTQSKRTELEEIMVEGYFRHALDEKKCVKFKKGELKIEGLATKSR